MFFQKVQYIVFGDKFSCRAGIPAPPSGLVAYWKDLQDLACSLSRAESLQRDGAEPAARGRHGPVQGTRGTLQSPLQGPAGRL